jgi:hypothetical protein
MPTLTTPSTVTFPIQIDQILTLTNNFGAGRVVLSAQKGGDVVFDYTNDQLLNTPVFSAGSQGLVTITHLSGSLTYNVSNSVLATLTTGAAAAVTALVSGAGISSVTYDDSSRVSSYTANGVAHTITYPTGTSALITNTLGASRSVTFDGSGRVTAII